MKLKLIPIAVLSVALILLAGACQGENESASVIQNGGGSAPVTSSCKIGAISWQDAAKHAGSTATVEGPVVGTEYASSSNGKPTFLNVGKPYPDPARFTVVIWGEDRGAFPKAPESLYKGKDICVSGVVQMYRGSPQIVVDSPDHIAFGN